MRVCWQHKDHLITRVRVCVPFSDERFGLFTVSSPVSVLRLIDRQGFATGDRHTQKTHARTNHTADIIIVWFMLCAFECIPMHYFR